jgi:hypothetical protein
MSQATADYFMFLDDDDCLLPGALDAVRREGVHRVPQMFHMKYGPRDCLLWVEPVLRVANVGGSMFVVPRIAGRFTDWPETDQLGIGDFHFITQTLSLWPLDALRWCPDVIYHCPVHSGGR